MAIIVSARTGATYGSAEKKAKKLPFAIIFLAFTNRACSKSTIGGGGQKNPVTKQSVSSHKTRARLEKGRGRRLELVLSEGGEICFITKELFGKGKALLCRSVSSLFLCLRVEEEGRGSGVRMRGRNVKKTRVDRFHKII